MQGLSKRIFVERLSIKVHLVLGIRRAIGETVGTVMCSGNGKEHVWPAFENRIQMT